MSELRNITKFRYLAPIAGLLMLTMCSGGGSGGGTITNPPVTTTPNRAPVLSSATSASVSENTSGVVYTATATDADGDALAFSIGGTDASAFSINASTGAIEFTSNPDFESPSDANTDNVYEITISVSDGNGGSASQTVTITVTDISDETGATGRYVDEVFSSVDVQIGLSFAPGLFMDIYTPSGDTETNRPILIAAAGGGFIEQNREDMDFIARAFARRGYVVAAIDYRVLTAEPLTADDLAIAAITATHDMFAAVRFFRADAQGANSFGIRDDAIFVTGESAGGIMAAIAATLDPSDTITSMGVSDFLAANGGAFGNVGDNDSVSSLVNGALAVSGGVLELGTVDASSAILYAAHEEFDPVVPCQTDQEGSTFTGLVISGSCDLVAAYTTLGVPAELFLVNGSFGHLEFTEEQIAEVYAGAAALFFNTVISPQ